MGVHAFSKGISLKVNVIAWLLHISYYVMRTLPNWMNNACNILADEAKLFEVYIYIYIYINLKVPT